MATDPRAVAQAAATAVQAVSDMRPWKNGRELADVTIGKLGVAQASVDAAARVGEAWIEGAFRLACVREICAGERERIGSIAAAHERGHAFRRRLAERRELSEEALVAIALKDADCEIAALNAMAPGHSARRLRGR